MDGKENDGADRSGQPHDEGAIDCPEEAQPTRAMITPSMPTQEEMDLHRITHLPYRPWCTECVEGFAREWPHRHNDVQCLIPFISCDYLYFSEKGISARDELDEEERHGSMRVLVEYCGATRAQFARALPHEAADSEAYAVEQLKQDIIWLGHSKLTIGGDNEPALVQPHLFGSQESNRR